ncbi:esterase family protein [Granulicella arctica]|uniref:Esterase/lipase superfamily enzyme n=1 Tax=Granulicella arctica TaxID=940613 RepID=A0A7Y9PII5_9BACT|nr:alpha/beta hydrolase-fold protein [Granulicella arctica]NYF80540.1 esterase/lipase superfamily enzyme [Granulicella arctica]
MKREWHKWFSPRLGRDMELLVFGHAGLPTIVFPTSCGRFYEFEDRGMVDAVKEQIERGEVQLICVDSVDAESWYNRNVGPRWRIARHVQYESYVMEEVIPLIQRVGHVPHSGPQIASLGCSFGGYHAANIALRHPDVFRVFLAMGAAFDLSNFLGGYHDQDCYFNIPTQYLPNTNDPWYLDRYRHNTYVLATGEHDICRGQTEHMAHLMRVKGIPVRLDVWGDGSHHDWPEWMKMVRVYL